MLKFLKNKGKMLESPKAKVVIVALLLKISKRDYVVFIHPKKKKKHSQMIEVM